uniref:Homeobox domain-containing protein n=1 Tax=Helicotheca tamesis TaxID=374047 RepID=A0A7S2DVR0_9STRA|mmetsp:Transcript_10273/g.14359  ORF Transcript_10273/g.14359 Transcript_10273/m.14359 type:complete len:779 (+) Transcript_10273:124-2460(+)
MVLEPSSTTVHPLNATPILSPPPSTSAISTAGQLSPTAVEVSDTENHSPQKNRRASKAKMSEAAVPDAAASSEDPPAANPAGSDGEGDDDENKGSGKGSGKSRRELPAGAVATLKAWLLSPEHFTHPYPTPQDQIILMQKTGIDKKQLKNWFTNARRRIWKPMLKKQLEQGKLATTPGGGGVAVPGVVPGLMAAPPAAPPSGTPITAPPAPPSGEAIAATPSDNMQAMHVHYQQAVQQHQPPSAQPHTPPSQPQQQYDAYGNPTYTQPQQPQQTQSASQPQQYSSSSYYQQPYGQQSNPPGAAAPAPIATSNSIGSLPPMTSSVVSSAAAGQMNKTDSHAVLMELFARDQDLVRQATEGARQKATMVPNPNTQGSADQVQQSSGVPMQQMGSQHPMKMMGSGARLGSVPALNSWPHFSSVSSLNNLGTMTGVKSITNMSAVDLASQGDMNKKGNLAQVKSIEKMGRADSFAFLEVFFDNNNGGQSSAARNVKREEDNDVGLSLDGDDSPSTNTLKPNEVSTSNTQSTAATGAPSPAPLTADGKDKEGTNNNRNLKRAYDDALAARGLISVSRSSEKLTDLALPAKMQRTLSQEYIRQHNIQPNVNNPGQQQYGSYNYNQNPQQNSSAPPPAGSASFPQQSGESQQYPGQHPQQKANSSGPSAAPLSDPSMSNASVEVPATTKCALCHCINVDTQLRPCGHMFHGRCLKPSLQSAMGPPKCPIDHIPMQSAVLAVPTDEKAPNAPQSSAPQQQKSWGSSGSLPSHQTSSAISAQNSATT